MIALPCLLKENWARAAAQVWVGMCLILLRLCCGVRYELEGERPAGAAIYASKHQSTLDTLILWRHLDGPAFILKQQLLLVPIFGWYLWRTGSIAINRKAGRHALEQIVAQATAKLAEGRNIVIFPEGTRTRPGEHRIYKKGGLRALYGLSAAPIVPVALNTGVFWPKRRYCKWPGLARVKFLAALPEHQDSEALLNKFETDLERESLALISA